MGDKQRREPKETKGSLTVKNLNDIREVFVNYLHDFSMFKENCKSCPDRHCLLCYFTPGAL